ncbi:bifunctional DNA primase/polymerase [Streptomyces sp. NPDC060194]|uniref:bifunctional DNA primase/polymerase n=1 Tax=Streptomyces sp. NPDC060194 TaxID=3347069 RepID=UPI00364DD44B
MTQPHPRARERDDRPPLLTAALAAAERGWAVFPLRPGGKRPALHPADRCPGVGDCADGHRKWEQRATTDPERVTRAWTAGAFNVGIATGPADLVVVDLDKPKGTMDAPDGAANFAALCERSGHAVPDTYRIRTASGGAHLYFAAPPGVRLGNTAKKLAPLVDTRAHGGYVVAAGSTIDGQAYEVADARPVADLPAWLTAALRPPAPPVRPVLAAPHRTGRRAAVVLERECAAVAGAPEGGRNAELLRAVRAVGRFVAWGEIDRSTVEAAFQEGGESSGLSASECRATIRSALDWSIRTARPREAA